MIINSNSFVKGIKNGLYLVATPIGNLGDITLRAIEVLNKSEYILCEDTRTSKSLLDRYEIKSKLISNHKFNEKKNLSKIIEILKNGSVVSLISDAGTPSISDPGSTLVNECYKYGIDVIPIPGASVVASAISVSGFSEKFLFYGFFPEKNKTLVDDLKILSEIKCSLVFFISAKKINKIIPFIKMNFTGRKIVICREISKIYEEFIRTDIDSLETFKSEIKGEITIVISEPKNEKKTSKILDESDKRNIKRLINKLSIKEITKLINENKNISKKEIYNYCLQLKNEI